MTLAREGQPPGANANPSEARPGLRGTPDQPRLPGAEQRGARVWNPLLSGGHLEEEKEEPLKP